MPCDTNESVATHDSASSVDPIGGDIEAARNSFRSAIQLFIDQGREQEAQALRSKAQGLVKLDAEPVF